MSYYQGAPGGYGQPPGYGGYPGQSSSPPGMAPGIAPGMAPGMGGPPGAPGMYQSQHPLPARPGAVPPGFPAPQNMPKFDLNAPVIRLGTIGGPKDNAAAGPRGSSNAEPLGARRGIGMDRNIEQQRAQIRENMMALQPPKPDEILKTIFVGNITEGCGGDAGIEAILRSAGNLRKWIRAIDADNKPCTFGFAEYEDSESLETAAEILEDVYVPVKKQLPRKQDQENGDTDDEVEKVKLLVVVDQASMDYAASWSKQRGDSEESIEFRLDGAKQALAGILTRLFHPTEEQDYELDSTMQETAQTQDPLTGEVITISLDKTEDELSDIPPEMRETVAAEISAFRERSTRRDLERLRREEEMEARERGSRANRLGSPPLSAPTGPGSANGIPVGPRGVQGAPSGPKGLRGGGVQIPKDYQNGVSFTHGSNELKSYLGKEDDDTDASDEELERRRRAKKETEQEKAYLDYERRWQNRERARAAALERERKKDEGEESRKESEAKTMAKQLRDWDDDMEANKKTHEYYADRNSWARNRLALRQREAAADAADRRAEDEERRSAQAAEDQARGLADSFLDRQAEELGARGISTQPRFKISLGAAAQKAQQANAPKKKTTVDVENLLDVDEAAGGEASKRELIPIKFDTLAEAAALTPEERQEALKQVALTVPQNKEGLFGWDVKWAGLSPDVIRQLKDWVESRSMDNFGVVEEMMWDVVQGVLKAKKKDSPSELIDSLEGLLEDETDGFVRKLWRMVVFLTECEVRGLNKERGD